MDRPNDTARRTWPVLRRYQGESRRAICLPVGGIGTGTVGFGGRGQLRDWELQNHPAKGSISPGTFFAVRVSGPGQPPVGRIVEGELFAEEQAGPLGSRVPGAGLPRFSKCTFETTYPFARDVLEDDDFPVAVEVEVFNPLIPADSESSGLPIASWRMRLSNRTSTTLDVSVMLSVGNFIGQRLRSGARDESRPWFEPRSEDAVVGVLLGDRALDQRDEEWGTFAAAVVGRTDEAWIGPVWSPGQWNQGTFNLWNGFVNNGRPAQADDLQELGGSVYGELGVPACTLGITAALEGHAHDEASFMFGWHFPNRRAWTFPGPGPAGGSGPEIVGNYYTQTRADAWEALTNASKSIDTLEAATIDFIESFVNSDLSNSVKEAALFNLSTLRSPTVFRTADGYPFGWEGVLEEVGSCPGTCTHVWNYEFATPFLFGDLAKKMRELEFVHAVADSGAMSFRIMLPLERAKSWGSAAADGQFGAVVKLYRDWQLSGDGELLSLLWPSCKRALEFAWLPGSWDSDVDGVAEGPLHNTMDVEYFGPNPLIQGWYLSALRAAARMARYVGDAEFSERCEELSRRGGEWTDLHLFNGEYYEQKIVPPGDFASVRPELRRQELGAQRPEDPEFQVGSGCLIDQLAGQVSGEIAGLGKVFDPVHAIKSLESVHRLNYVPRFGNWANYMRSYALNDDRGHIMLAYPLGLPEHPMPYWCEVMTGFEYTFAIALVQAGQRDLAEDVVTSVRDRYDGQRRNPFSETECGFHYARAMASWGLIPALTGFHYSAVDEQFAFHASDANATYFWSTGAAWGTIEQSVTTGRHDALIKVKGGAIRVRSVLIGPTLLSPSTAGEFTAGDVIEVGF